MSDDLIKREDAIAEICKARTPDVASHQYAELFINAVRRAPSADRPQGEWIPCTKGGLPLTELGRRERQKWYGYKCSKCNFIYKGNALTESPFCQNCGARMKGKNDESTL